MTSHFNEIVVRRRGELRDVTSYAARWNEQAWRLSVCIHAGEHGGQAHEHELDVETAARAIELADWFADCQLEILSAGRASGRRQLRDDVLELLADNPNGIRATDIYRARITANADSAHALLNTLEAEGVLICTNSQPEHGGSITRKFVLARKGR
jgi:hypothetical protein